MSPVSATRLKRLAVFLCVLPLLQSDPTSAQDSLSAPSIAVEQLRCQYERAEKEISSKKYRFPVQDRKRIEFLNSALKDLAMLREQNKDEPKIEVKISADLISDASVRDIPSTDKYIVTSPALAKELIYDIPIIKAAEGTVQDLAFHQAQIEHLQTKITAIIKQSIGFKNELGDDPKALAKIALEQAHIKMLLPFVTQQVAHAREAHKLQVAKGKASICAKSKSASVGENKKPAAKAVGNRSRVKQAPRTDTNSKKPVEKPPSSVDPLH